MTTKEQVKAMIKAAQDKTMNDFQTGDRVYVEFLSESGTESSRTYFKGKGVIDLVDDYYIFGRLDTGEPFMCPFNRVKHIEEKSEHDHTCENRLTLAGWNNYG